MRVYHKVHGHGEVLEFHPAGGGQYNVSWDWNGCFWVYANEVDILSDDDKIDPCATSSIDNDISSASLTL